MTLRRARLEALVLLVLTVALGAYLWSSQHAPTTSDREGREQNVLPTFESAQVRQIAITEAGAPGGATVLRRQPDSTDPHEYLLDAAGSTGIEVDRAELASLLRTLDFATFVRTTEARLLPAEAFGPSAPKLVLDVTMDSVSYHVVVGAAAESVAGGRYAEVTGNDGSQRAGVVPESLTSALTRDARELRGRRLFPYGKSQTQRLVIEHNLDDRDVQTVVLTTLTADPLGFSVTRTSTPAKDASAPSVAAPRRAAPARVDGLFFQLARASFEAYPAVRTAPSTPPVIVTQEPGTGPEIRLEVGGECPEHPGLVQVVRTAPDQLVGCTDEVLLDTLAPRELGLRGLWPLTVSEIDHLVIRSGGHTLDLIRDGASFRRLAPDPGLIELGRGNEYLQDLSSLALTEVPCRGEASGEVRVVGQPEGSADGRELNLTLLRDRDDSLVRREDDGACLLLSERASWLLDPNSAWYESLELFNVRADDVVALTTFGPHLRREELVRSADALTLAGSAVDEALLSDLLGELDPLSALRIAPRRDGAPWTPQFELHLRARSSGPFTLRVGPRVRGGYLAQLNGRRSEFVLAPHVVRVLTTSLQSRQPAQWDPAAFLDLSVSARGVTYHFRKVGDELVPTDDAPRELGAALTEALSRLLPIAAVRDDRAPRRSSSSELSLAGSYDAGGGVTKQLSVSLGEQMLHGEQLVQQMTIGDSDARYYVDRAAVLAVLDLL